jgi:molecular chaperone DnaK (HSP70)
MRLGVDFGTTRIVVAAVDRGNYPIVTFQTPQGEVQEWYPALIAVHEGKRLYGWQAYQAQQEAGATIVRSIKRYLQDAGPRTRVEIAGESVGMLELLTGLFSGLRAALEESPGLKLGSGEKLEVMLGVPANANGNQRFLTVEAFHRAGFEVLGLLNEPSAASIEYGHGVRKQGARTRDTILVYDLGGGTFDASVVEMDENRHAVLESEGIPSLGGDDFDEILAELALEGAGIDEAERETLTQAEWFRLLEECRRKKETLHPNSRKLMIELEQVRENWPTVAVAVSDFYEHAQGLIDETVHAVQDLMRERAATIEAVYVTGGASDLPLVTRALRENFGRRVKRSAYTRSATAIGLAIQADHTAGYQLRERFTRNFGVWREAEGGRAVVFDPLFLKGTPLPGAGETPLVVRRGYRAAHNIGHFRYLECSHTSADGRPAGEVTVWDEILFPFDAGLAEAELSETQVERREWEPPVEVEESYSVDASGAVTVVISNRTAGYEKTYRLGRWAAPQTPVVPGRKRARRAAARQA